MPQELMVFSPAYLVVGVYRLLTDPLLYGPMWKQSQKAFKKGALLACIWLPWSYAPTRFFIKHFAKKVQLAKHQDDAVFLGLSLVTYTTWVYVIGQCSAILHFFIAKELRAARQHAYEATIKSRGKPADFWIPYVEEWREPPVDRARRAMEKQGLYDRLDGTLVRTLVRFLLLPVAFVPFLTLIVTALLKSVTMAQRLHTPYFDRKAMSPYERQLFMVERQYDFRLFGFFAALLERMPIIGLGFQISNRIGAAMHAFDMEKTQHAYKDGTKQPTKVYVSKTAQVESDLPDDAVGAFPSRKHALRPEASDTGVHLRVAGKKM